MTTEHIKATTLESVSPNMAALDSVKQRLRKELETLGQQVRTARQQAKYDRAERLANEAIKAVETAQLKITSLSLITPEITAKESNA